jgi:hypothetical protein
MLVLLVVSAFVFVSCSPEAGGGGGVNPGPGPAPKPKEEVKNVLGDMKTIIDYDFDEEAPHKQLTGDGSTLTYAEGKGMDNSDAILVEQNYNYGQVAIDMTKFYARGKSYYIEAYFRFADDVEGALESNACAKVDFSLITGAGYNYYPDHQTWDIPGQYDGSMMYSDPEDIFELEDELTLQEGEDITNPKDQWHKVCGLLDAKAIETVIASMDDQCHATGESTLYEFNLILLVGTYSDDETAGQKGYKYYLDNVKVIDLNDEIDVEGQTYEIPEEEEGDGEDETT